MNDATNSEQSLTQKLEDSLKKAFNAGKNRADYEEGYAYTKEPPKFEQSFQQYIEEKLQEAFDAGMDRAMYEEGYYYKDYIPPTFDQWLEELKSAG